MASAALSTGEERLDMLIRMVPVIYPGSNIIVDGLSVLTAVMINDTQCCSRIGVADVVRYKLEEIRSVRQSREDIDNVDVCVLYDFYFDVMRCYAGAERRRLTEEEFKKMSSYDPMTSLKGVVDGEFSKIHDALATLGKFFLPESWRSTGTTQFRCDMDTEARKRLSYCYIRLFQPSVQFFVASILGPRPTLGSVLSLLSDRVCRSAQELDGFYVVRKDNNDLHLTRNAPLGAHLVVDDLMQFRDEEDFRSSGLLSIFDRIGAALAEATHDAMFEEAINCLADIVSAVQDQPDEDLGSYRLANVDFDVPDTIAQLPDGSESLRTIFNNGYLPSFVKTWPPKVRCVALARSLIEYNDRVLNLHVTSVGLTQLKVLGKLKSCDAAWRKEVAELVSLSKTDADYWYEVSEILADNFRKLQSSTVPEWLQQTLDLKTDEFLEAALRSIVKPHKPPSKPASVSSGFSRSRTVSNSSTSSQTSVGSSGSVSTHSTRTGCKLPPECRERFDALMAGPERKIPGFEANMPLGHRFKLAGADCYRRYKIRYVKNLVLRE